MIDEPVRADLHELFGWDAYTVSAGARGALGRIWRIDVGPDRYALKQIFADPPSSARIDEELAYARRAIAAGVRLPASYRDRTGRFLIPSSDGTWLRLYEWIDLRPAEPAPERLGILLARLHRCAPAATSRPGPWYETIPAAWPDVSGPAWADRYADRLATLPELGTAIEPADPAALIVCHRDLHPENVLADADGELVVVDWDGVGPASPGRELAGMLFDWFCDGPADLEAMRTMYAAYVAAGGPGRVTEPADFTMLLASRLNFLLAQVRVALDPDAPARDRNWAEREIDEALRILPTPAQLAEVLELTRAG